MLPIFWGSGRVCADVPTTLGTRNPDKGRAELAQDDNYAKRGAEILTALEEDWTNDPNVEGILPISDRERSLMGYAISFALGFEDGRRARGEAS